MKRSASPSGSSTWRKELSASTPTWTWQSMSPGITVLPAAVDHLGAVGNVRLVAGTDGGDPLVLDEHHRVVEGRRPRAVDHSRSDDCLGHVHLAPTLLSKLAIPGTGVLRGLALAPLSNLTGLTFRLEVPA